jgi:surfactin synthase thioesterase subunit/acyl carrier protein
MIPSVLVVLDKMPLTTSGKVDRKALPAPEAPRAESTYAAPQTVMEERLAAIWAEILRVERVGMHDNFFELGGDSLLAARLVGQMRERLKLELSLQSFFSGPTVAESIKHIKFQPLKTTEVSSGHYRIPLRSRQGSRHMVAFMPTILGSGLNYAELAGHIAPGIDVQTCRLPGNVKGEVPLTRIEDLATHCLTQLIVPGEYDEWSLVGWSFGGILAYEVARQMAASGLPVRRLILIDTFLPVITLQEFRALKETDLSKAFSAIMALTSEPGGNNELREIFKANFQAMCSYTYVPSDLPVVEIRAEKGPLTQDGAVGGREIQFPKKRVLTVPGDHYSIFSKDHIQELADAINNTLTAANPG